MKASADNRFDELFRERFRDFSENPPVSVLEKLKATTSGISNPVPLWKKGGFFATVGIVLISGITILLINSFSAKETITNNTVLAENNSTNAPATIVNISQNGNNESIVNNEKTITSTLADNNSSENNETLIPRNKSENIATKSETETTKVNDENPQELKSTNNVSQNDINVVINISVKSATCRKSNGKAVLSANTEKVEFYWMDIDKEKPHSTMENLRAGNYNIKSVIKEGFIKNFIVSIPDSAILRAGFTHYSMTDAIGVPVYFYNKSTIDGNPAYEIENTTFKWYFGDGKTSFEAEPEHMYNSTGPFTVSLVAVSPLGCKDSVTLPPLNIAGSDIEFPSIFTPNGDGQNDIFMPVVQALRSFHCIIMNRNGEQLYEWNDPTKGWDGKINNGLELASPGIYFYILKGVGIDGKIITHKGRLQLAM